MRLLRCEEDGSVGFTADLPDSEAARLKYAILSHTWGRDGEEVLFEDIISNQGKEKVGFQKLLFCARLARQHGLDYFWIDTCCIDKKNHAELSKSLISMFRWYSNAEVCCVFLSDVPRTDQAALLGGDWELDFRYSRWFKRGWTLQELIAPTKLEFYSRNGTWLGTKASLEREINEVTHIPIRALRGQALADFTLRERQQWQQGRETREPEDIVYSLFGLLDVYMPVLYGEGSLKAQQRLEDAITIAQRGTRHLDFSITFGLSEAVETHHFIARENELRGIRNALRTDGGRKAVVIHGLGGIGKTQLAIAYAKRCREDHSALFWVNANDEDSVTSSFVNMSRRICREHPQAMATSGLNLDKSPLEIVEAVKDWFSLPMNSRWLMICDNYDNPKVSGNSDPMAFDLRRYFPDTYQGSILVTTRSSEVNVGHRMKIEKLNELQDGLKILESSSGRENLASDHDAVKLAQKLDGLPLALVTAGAYLSQSTITFAQYLGFYEHSWTSLQRTLPALDTYENRTLFSTWQVSFDSIERRNKSAANLLRLWAYFDNRDLWFELLNHSNEQSFGWWQDLTRDQLTFESCMKMLCIYGLAEPNRSNEYEYESTGYSVHACVHSWMLHVLNAKQNDDFKHVALMCVTHHSLALHYEAWYKTKRTLLANRRLLGHVDRCSAYFQDFTGFGKREARVLASRHMVLAELLNDQAKRAEAEDILRRVLKQSQIMFGRNDETTLQVTHRLGNVCRSRGNLEEAEVWMEQTLEARQIVLGNNDQSTLRTAYALGSIYLDRDNLGGADELLRRALQGQENVLGQDHPDTIDSIYTLSILCERQGNLEETEYRCKQSLAARIKVLGEDDLSTLQNMAALGYLYLSRRNLVEAEKTCQQAVEGYDRAVGPDELFSPRALILRILGEVYREQGRLVEAEQAISRAIRQSHDGPQQHNLWKLSTYAALGIVYVLQGRMVEAEQCYQRAREGYYLGMTPYQKRTVDQLQERISASNQDKPSSESAVQIRAVGGSDFADTTPVSRSSF